MSSGKADKSAATSNISVLPPSISRAVLLLSTSGIRKPSYTSAISVESTMCGPRPLASLSTSSAGSSPLLQGSACVLPLLFLYMKRQEIITRKDVVRTQPTAMPVMIACERCDELGGLSGFGGLLEDVSFDAIPKGNGSGNGGRLATASAGQLVGK